MGDKIVHSSFKTAIRPTDINLDRDAPTFISLMGTLDKMEFENIARDFLCHSQDAGVWSGLVYEKKAERNSDFADMVAQDYLNEKQVDGEWVYELSQLAIEQLYVRQSKYSIRSLRSELEHARSQTVWARLRRLFKLAPIQS